MELALSMKISQKPESKTIFRKKGRSQNRPSENRRKRSKSRKYTSM